MRASDEKPLLDAGAGDAGGRSQADVLRAAVDGAPWALAALYDALYPFVASALQKILHKTPDYEDLVQTSFELIVRTLQRPRARPIENLAAWASAIAARVALDALRSRVRERRIFNRELEPTNVLELVAGPRLERELDARSDLLWLQRTLADMNAEQAETLVLHDVLGHDLWEVARLTDVSPAAAQKRLSRGHIDLKQRAERRDKAGRK
ncbi:MAG TPA: sigma-70 family RNA polymerase sigma factor [Polyangia bacterium]|jgi:RNA polymerase sigma-70 factor (ECF subfamily)|nr:sigma-70 family RNA polymerase sigma factor [Polyangia bacterium]